ncbi:uncharacterized protein ACB058_018702 isoform 1-T1 [Synchiropus picturatus]
MSFLTIPCQENLFTTIKQSKSSEQTEDKSRNSDEEEEDEDDDDTENVRLIPRCSPVPRKRGSSIHDETAEYMRIHQALSAGKRVSFADTTGGDLVDVKEFVAFDSDDEGERWDEERAKYRRPDQEPTYHVHPEFNSPSGSALLQAVHRSKVEVEKLSCVESEPLAFTGIVRVLNISFHKAVYIRSTMDNWTSYFDHPAEYVQGSCDGDTDQFSFRLSFAPPFITHGSRIEFVVRYETSDGDFWANNSSMNYVVTLLLTYEDDSTQSNTDMQQIKGILRPPKAYSDVNDFDSEDEEENNKESASEPADRAVPMESEIDVEQVEDPLSGAPAATQQETPPADGITHTASSEEPRESFQTAPDSFLSSSLELLSESDSHAPEMSPTTPPSSCLDPENPGRAEEATALDVPSTEACGHTQTEAFMSPGSEEDVMPLSEEPEESLSYEESDHSPSSPPDGHHYVSPLDKQEDASQASERPAESDQNMNLMPSVYLLGGVVFFTMVWQEPSVLVSTALLLLLHRL